MTAKSDETYPLAGGGLISMITPIAPDGISEALNLAIEELLVVPLRQTPLGFVETDILLTIGSH